MEGKKKEEARVVDVTEEEKEKETPSFLDRVHDLVLCLNRIEDYKKHPGIVMFRKRLEETMAKLDPSDPNNKKIIERNLRREEIFQEVFEKFYNDGRSTLLKGNLTFLIDTDYKIIIGRNGETHLPIGEIYTALEKDASPKAVNVEACVFLLCQFICPDEDLGAISDICEEFKEEPTAAPGNFFDMIGDVVDKASSKFTKYGKELEGSDGKINRNVIADITRDIMDDDEITVPFQQMISQVGGEDFDINEIRDQIMNRGEGKSKK